MDEKMKKGYLATGAALALASTALMLDVMIRKRAKKSLVAAGFFVGLAGIAAGAAVASYPKVKAVKQLGSDELFDLDDIDLLDQGILDELEEDDDVAELPVAEDLAVQAEDAPPLIVETVSAEVVTTSDEAVATEVTIETTAEEITDEDDDDSIDALEISFEI